MLLQQIVDYRKNTDLNNKSSGKISTSEIWPVYIGDYITIILVIGEVGLNLKNVFRYKNINYLKI